MAFSKSASRLASQEFGITVAAEYVAAYGPVSILEITRALQEQTWLTARNCQQVIQYGIAELWEEYSIPGTYWLNKPTKIKFDFPLLPELQDTETWLKI